MSETNIKPEEISSTLLESLATKLKVTEETKHNWQQKLSDLKTVFLNSEATVYCEDCGVVFFYGKTNIVVREERFVDWKMLSFRHCWDTRHKVKVYMPFFLATQAQVSEKNTIASTLIKRFMTSRLDFDEVGQMCFYVKVDQLRKHYDGTLRGQHTHDENWDVTSRCVCSVCDKVFYDPKAACLCHSEVKRWLPLEEVKGIDVRKLAVT